MFAIRLEAIARVEAIELVASYALLPKRCVRIVRRLNPWEKSWVCQ